MGSLNTPYFIVHVASEFLNKGAEAAREYFKAEKGEVKHYDKFIVAKLPVPVVNIIFALELIPQRSDQTCRQRGPGTQYHRALRRIGFRLENPNRRPLSFPRSLQEICGH
jgi:hypothetical protein